MSRQDGHVSVKNPLICLLPILFCSLLLNTWGIDWGLSWNTDGWGWHPDEVTPVSSRMLDQRSLNPHSFAYGPLHYYEVMFFAVIPAKIVTRVLKSISGNHEGARDSSDQQANSFASTADWQWWWSRGPLFLSRVLSGLFGTGTVLLVYLLAMKLFDRKAALISALLLAVSMVFVVYAHHATVAMSSTFWFTLSCLMSVYVWSSGGRRWSALSGLTAGLAAAVKYVGGVAIVPLLLAHVFSAKRTRSYLFLALLMVVVGFLLGFPVVLYSFSEFLDGASKELFFNAARPPDEARGFWALVVLLKDALGLPLFLVSICGLLYSLKLLTAEGERAKGLLLWSMLLPYCLLIGSHDAIYLWYTLPILPFLSILNGKMFGDLLTSEVKGLRTASWALLGAAASSSLLYTIGADLQFVKDSRHMAAEWIAQNVPSRSQIEVPCCGIPIPRNGYSVVVRPINWAESAWLRATIEGRDKSQGYVFIQKLASGAEQIGGKLGLSRDRKPYVAWYEFVLERDRQALALKEFDFTLKGLQLRNPDYLVVADTSGVFGFLKGFPYEKFYSKESTEYQFYDALFRGRTAYKKITQIRFQFLPWLDVEIPYVNPNIYVFGRK